MGGLSVKIDPEEFGGLQGHVLDPDRLAKVMCCSAGCDKPSFVQIRVPLTYPVLFRAVCKQHFLLTQMLTWSALGDSVPSVEIKGLADALGLDLATFLETEPDAVSHPMAWRCFSCGGRMVFVPAPEDPTEGDTVPYPYWWHACGIDGHD